MGPYYNVLPGVVHSELKLKHDVLRISTFE